MMPSSGKRFFRAATARGTRPLGFSASRPSADFSRCSITGKSARTGMRSFRHCSASGSSLSTVMRSTPGMERSEEHTSELQSQSNLVCRLLLEKKKLSHHPHHRPHHAPRSVPLLPLLVQTAPLVSLLFHCTAPLAAAHAQPSHHPTAASLYRAP